MINKRTLIFLVWALALTVNAEISSQLEASSLHFISKDFGADQDKNLAFLGAEIKSQSAENDIFKINLTGKYTPQNKVLSYINLKEIYLTNAIKNNDKNPQALHFGRKIQTWSVGDELWNLGSYQPQFRWNPLDVESQGLFGLFYDKSFGLWHLSLFGTPFFIPDQGPAYEVKDGQFESTNPYFTPPPQNIIFQNVLLPIDYNIIKPEVSEVVQQPGFGLKLDFKNDDYETTFAGTYKPSNQFAFGYKGILVTNRVRVDVAPKTYYEKLTSLDLAKKWSGGRSGLSVIYNEPETPDYAASFNSPIFQVNTAIIPYIRLDFKSVEYEVAGLFIDGGTIKEVGPEADPERPSLTQKYLYHRAYQLSVHYKHDFGENLKLTTLLQWREAEKNLLQTLKWKNIFDIKGPWKITLDLFLVETSDEATAVSQYRNLDQVWAGASYEF